MEEDLKILKVEYLSNHWLDLPQILNLSLVDRIKMKNTWNEKGPTMEDNLKNIKIWISQQPIIGSSSNFKLKLR